MVRRVTPDDPRPAADEQLLADLRLALGGGVRAAEIDLAIKVQQVAPPWRGAGTTPDVAPGPNVASALTTNVGRVG